MMESPEWTSIGIVGVLSLLLLREVLNFLSTRLGTTGSLNEQAKAAATLEAELRNLSTAISSLAKILNTLTHEMKLTQAELKEARKDIEELKRRIP